MKSAIISLSCLATVLLLSSVAYAGDPDAGKDKAKVCAACHGENGVSQTADFPKLAGQYDTYIKRALADYQSGQRKNPIMAQQAQALSGQDIDDLAAFFSTQPAAVATKY